MSIDIDVKLMYGIVVTPEELERIQNILGTLDLDLDYGGDVEEMLSKAFHMYDRYSVSLLGASFNDDPYTGRKPISAVVYAKSSYVGNDAKRGTGELFDKTIIGKDELNIPDEEKKALKKFKKFYDLSGKIQMTVMGTFC